MRNCQPQVLTRYKSAKFVLLMIKPCLSKVRTQLPKTKAIINLSDLSYKHKAININYKHFSSIIFEVIVYLNVIVITSYYNNIQVSNNNVQ